MILQVRQRHSHVPTLLPRSSLSVAHLVSLVSERFHVSVPAIRGRARRRDLQSARQVAMWLCRELTIHSTTQLGYYFGYRYHTVIMYAHRKVERERQAFPAVAEFLAALVSDAREPQRKPIRSVLLLPEREVAG